MPRAVIGPSVLSSSCRSSGSSVTDTFGTRFVALVSARERLQLEQIEQRRAPFADVDRALQQLIHAALSGERVASVSGSRNEDRIVAHVELGLLNDTFGRH